MSLKKKIKSATLAIVCLYPAFLFAENPCAKEGEEWHPFIFGSGSVSCCKGLTSTSKWLQENLDSKCLPGPPGDNGYCVKCGDGKCDTPLFENKCNCPKDCK